MKICIKIATAILNIIYGILKLLPSRKKIVFLSRQYDTSNVDFDLMIAYMKEMYPEYSCKVLAKRIGSGIGPMIGYGFHTLHQMYELATSSIAVLDTYCIPVSILKHKDSLLVVQIWHALGAFKKFGYSVVGKEEGSSAKIAAYMQMHKNYDYVCTSSAHCIPYFAEAFAIEEDNVKIFPLPRLDVLLDQEKQREMKAQIYKTYPKLLETKKKVILYAPTFRKEEGSMEKPIEELLGAIDFTKYECIVKLHPLSKDRVGHSEAIIDEKFETADMLLVADVVITDYSAIIFEAAVLEKPIYLYGFDYKAYINKRDFYLDYENDIPGILYEQGQQLMAGIEREEADIEEIKAFRRRYVAEKQQIYTADICEFLIEKS